MAEVEADGQITIPFTFDGVRDDQFFASRLKLIERLTQVRAELEANPTPRLAALVGALTDELSHRNDLSALPVDYDASGDPLKKLLNDTTNKSSQSKAGFAKKPFSKPGALKRPVLKDYLKKNDDITPHAVLHLFMSDEKFRSELCAVFAAHGNPIYTAPEKQPTYLIAANTPYWKGRDDNDRRNPVEFIKENYGRLLPDGTWKHEYLTRAQLKRDPELYAAYATWVARHVDDALMFAPGPAGGRTRIDNPYDAIDRRRTSDAASQKNTRARRADVRREPS